MRAVLLVALLIAGCQESAPVALPELGPAEAFITYKVVGGEAALVASRTEPERTPFTAQVGELQIAVLAYDRSLEALGLVEGELQQADPEARLPRPSLPRPDRAWSITSGEPSAIEL